MNTITATEIRLTSITFCKYQLQIAKKEMLLSFPQLLDLRNRINQLSLHHSLEEIIDTDNFVLLFVADRQHLVYLDIPLLISLKHAVDAIFHKSNPVLI
jgi:hypothetical protein